MLYIVLLILFLIFLPAFLGYIRYHFKMLLIMGVIIGVSYWLAPAQTQKFINDSRDWIQSQVCPCAAKP